MSQVEELDFSPEFKDLVNQMLQSNPEDRIFYSEIIAHPWFVAAEASSEEVADFM